MREKKGEGKRQFQGSIIVWKGKKKGKNIRQHVTPPRPHAHVTHHDRQYKNKQGPFYLHCTRIRMGICRERGIICFKPGYSPPSLARAVPSRGRTRREMFRAGERGHCHRHFQCRYLQVPCRCLGAARLKEPAGTGEDLGKEGINTICSGDLVRIPCPAMG